MCSDNACNFWLISNTSYITCTCFGIALCQTSHVQYQWFTSYHHKTQNCKDFHMTTSLLNTNVKTKDVYFYKFYSRPHTVSRHCSGTSIVPNSQIIMPDVISDCRKSEFLLFAILHKMHTLKSPFGMQYLSACSTVTRCLGKFGSWCSKLHLL